MHKNSLLLKFTLFYYYSMIWLYIRNTSEEHVCIQLCKIIGYRDRSIELKLFKAFSDNLQGRDTPLALIMVYL